MIATKILAENEQACYVMRWEDMQPLGIVDLDASNQFVISAADPADQSKLRALVKNKYRVAKLRVGADLTPAEFLEGLPRFMNGTIYGARPVLPRHRTFTGALGISADLLGAVEWLAQQAQQHLEA